MCNLRIKNIKQTNNKVISVDDYSFYKQFMAGIHDKHYNNIKSGWVTYENKAIATFKYVNDYYGLHAYLIFNENNIYEICIEGMSGEKVIDWLLNETIKVNSTNSNGKIRLNYGK